MNNIDEIMKMIDWNNTESVQENGRLLAKEIKSINVFIQPLHIGCNKNVWDNCAIILSQRSDAELKPYLHKLFEWLIDMNWPGAYCIYDRLCRFQDKELLDYYLNICMQEARALHEEVWENTLSDFKLRLKNK